MPGASTRSLRLNASENSQAQCRGSVRESGERHRRKSCTDGGDTEGKQLAGRTYYPMTHFEVDFDSDLDTVTQLPTFYAFG